jgi:hypothetical protein
MQPIVATCVIEVPVSVYQLFDGVRIDARQRCRNTGTSGDDFSVHDELPVRVGKHGNVSARAQKNADVTAKSLDRDLRSGGFFQCVPNEVVTSGKEPSGKKARCGGRHPTCNNKLAREISRDDDAVFIGFSLLAWVFEENA